MNFKYTLLPLFVLSQMFLLVHAAEAGKIYRWTDEDGIVHYSDVPPADTTLSGTQEIKLDLFDENSVDPDFYSIINQVDRMAERRRQLTEERLAIKRLQLEEKRLANEREINQLNEIISAQDDGSQSLYYYPSPKYFNYPYSQHLYNLERHRHHGQGLPDRSWKTHRAVFMPNGRQTEDRYIKFRTRFSHGPGFYR